MTQPEGFVIYNYQRENGLSLTYLSKEGGDVDPIARINGTREWVPSINDAVETFWIRRDAEKVCEVYGGRVGERALLERAEGIRGQLEQEPARIGRGL